MAIERLNCDRCTGAVADACDYMFTEEAGIIGESQLFDGNEEAIAKKDPTKSKKEVDALIEANQLENVHFFDCRKSRLEVKLGNLGCGLDGDGIRKKLLIRIAGD